MSTQILSIPPLVSGGLMLSYRCTSKCRHCLYRCSPYRPDEWISLDTAEKIFAALQKEPRLHAIHIAGGEPTIKWPLLVDVIRLAAKMKVPVEYMETNASWCGSRATTQDKMEELRDAGLRAILVSVSMFHNEFVPFSSTRNCVELAQQVFGHENTLLYLPHMYEMISSLPGDGKHGVEEFCRHHGIKPGSSALLRLYDIVPSGRAISALRPCYQSRPAGSFDGQSCSAELLSTTHFHIDHNGDLFTGCCAGIMPATVPDLHPAISAESHPVFHTLCTRGPVGLMETAGEPNGFKPRREGYASKCDLCIHVREHIRETGKFRELRPAYFYRE
jgi:hypothetical protein